MLRRVSALTSPRRSRTEINYTNCQMALCGSSPTNRSRFTQEVGQRAERYALQGAPHALAVSRVMGMTVRRVEFVCSAAYPDRAEVFTVHDPDLDSVR